MIMLFRFSMRKIRRGDRCFPLHWEDIEIVPGQTKESYYQKGLELMEQKAYHEAVDVFLNVEELKNYKDTAEKIREAHTEIFVELYTKHRIFDAFEYLLNHIDDINIAEEVEKCVYSCIRQICYGEQAEEVFALFYRTLDESHPKYQFLRNMILYERGKYLEYYVSIGEAKNLYEQITGELSGCRRKSGQNPTVYII